jgi:murein DD-endopeptidase MepM/ murein hydrolase activator NlpD
MARCAVVAAVLVVGLLGGSAAASNPGTDKARIDARIGDLRDRAVQATRAEGVLSTQLSSLGARTRAAEAAVATAQARLDRLQASLAAERARLASLERTIAAQTARLVVLRRQYRVAVGVLERHLRALYEADDPDIVGFALGARSFSELLDNYDFLNRLGRQDGRIASSVERARDALAANRAATQRDRAAALRSAAAIARSAAAQAAVRDHVVASRNELVAAQNAKSRALASVREDRASFVAEADSLAAESAALAARIAAAQSAAAAAPASTPTAPAGGGQLSWPVAGPVTSGFGSRWGRMHEGIDIGVGSGTPVHAAAAGTVIYAGWMSGYGNIVVIDHGNGLSTAYAHNTELLVAVGSAVGKGNVIAFSGSTGHSTGPHVHFEVRVNGAPVDPLAYL